MEPVPELQGAAYRRAPRYKEGVSPGLRDPLGLDGSQPPKDREELGRALRHQLRQVQPGLAMILNRLTRLRRDRTDPGPPPRKDS